VSVCSSPETAPSHLAADDVDVVLTDYRMPGQSGIDLCASIVASRRDVPVVVMTAFGSMESAIAAMRAGACDFVTKPLDVTELDLTLERVLRPRARSIHRRARSAGGPRGHASSCAKRESPLTGSALECAVAEIGRLAVEAEPVVAVATKIPRERALLVEVR
jgi:DNA-binding NtrC family response regulator